MPTKKQKDCVHLVARLPSIFSPHKPDYRCVKCGEYHSVHEVANFMWSRHIGDKLMDTAPEAVKRRTEHE